MTKKERAEWDRLSRKWATQKATMKEMARCMELKRKHEAEYRSAAGLSDLTMRLASAELSRAEPERREP